jgi:prepilin-type N-terminal cleavage/methylation domain-containing protein
MILSKNKSGFTLIETLLSTAIMALILTPVLTSESTIFQSVIRRSRSFERFFQAQQFMLQTRRTVKKDARQMLVEKKVFKPDTMLKYELKEVQADSALASTRDLLIETVTWDWSDGRNKPSDSMVTLLYRPKKSS